MRQPIDDGAGRDPITCETYQGNSVTLGKLSKGRVGRRLACALLAGVAASPAFSSEVWQPFPPALSFNDFGGIGLLQTPTARFAPDGQLSLGANHVWPYDRYFLTIQAMPWLEGTLRLTTVRNRLYSPFPEFSGTQSYKDRGFDLKIRLLTEDDWRPGLAFGLRDFLGTGLFSSEFIVANKSAGPLDVSLGIGWGNMASGGKIPNPLRLISSRFDNRGAITAGGGSLNASYFKGRDVGLFGGIKYETPIKGLILKAEYDANDYKHEALGNRFRSPLPVNAGVEYAVRSWLHVGAAIERGNRVGLNLVATTNFNRPFRIPKFDPPPVPVSEIVKTPAQPSAPPADPVAPIAIWSSPPMPIDTTIPQLNQDEIGKKLAASLGNQGAGLYSADFQAKEVTLYIAQSRFASMPMGLGRMARAAFAVLPPQFEAVRFVFVENGIETIGARIYRSSFIDTLTNKVSPEELLRKVDFSEPPLGIGNASYQGKLNTAPPRFFYSIRPFLKTTLGRPEQFLLYEAGVRLNGFLQVKRQINVQGSIAVNLSDNFDKLQIPSNSTLPHVRSDIKDYLREGKTSLSSLHANYVFNISPKIYGHVYAGLLEEMYGGVGGEILYRPALSDWAVGADVTWVKKRAFDQRFDFLGYNTVTGFVTVARYFPDANINVRVRVGRYLAKDYGGTLEVARTFDSGVTVGAFATKTNVSASDFGEGRFDKGIFLSVPLDAIYSRHVRGNVGISYRPLIRDGGQMVVIPQRLIDTTDDTILSKFRRDWAGIDD